MLCAHRIASHRAACFDLAHATCQIIFQTRARTEGGEAIESPALSRDSCESLSSSFFFFLLLPLVGPENVFVIAR